MTQPTSKESIRRHPLFSGLNSAEAEELIDQCEQVAYSRGEKILYAKTAREGLLLILEGVTEVFVDTDGSASQEVLEVLEAGEMLGFSSLADFLGEPNEHEESYTVEVRAAEETSCLHIPYSVLEARWHDETVRDYVMRQVAVRLREIYASLAEQVRLSRQWGESEPFIRRVQDLMNAPPVTLPESTPVKEAAVKMEQHAVSSLIIVNESGGITGIMTEKDIVNRFVAPGKSDGTVKDIMTPDPVVIGRSAYYYQALSTFLVNGIKHLPVVSGTEPAGIVTLSDLLRSKNRGTFDILQEIEASSPEKLPEVRTAIYGVLGKLLEDGIPIKHVLSVITSLYDRLIRHCIELALEEMKADDEGEPPCAFGFFVMGSAGRAEQFLLTDQDHFLVYENVPADQQKEADRYFERLGAVITSFLETAGYKRCDGDMMAEFKQWRGSINRWEERIRTWGLRATNDNILLGHNFLAFRFLYGDEVLRDSFTSMVKQQMTKSRIFLYRAAENEKQALVPTLDHPIRALFRMKRDKLDIKKEALFPLYHSLQLLSAQHEIVEATPAEAIRALRRRKVFSEQFTDEIMFAYEVLLAVRVSQSWSRYQRGEESSSEVQFVHMKTREKEELIIALKAVRSLQNQMLASFGIM
ncbi:DUF294 nucleotidyltransferase-like domain-containing protein [Bacillus daqingensis]|uniref:DUF294 nucleotidyltransferase-like domain-containing protein n=1 Tax=Bacillus daqingensis TaxID=872396 RepID=A0ABV9NWM0_9BACI